MASRHTSFGGLKRKAQQQRNPGHSIGFARSLFWVSWIGVLLFVVGDLLQAETQGYGQNRVRPGYSASNWQWRLCSGENANLGKGG
jgi:hypothetical protein